jgi:hypothetical protein
MNRFSALMDRLSVPAADTRAVLSDRVGVNAHIHLPPNFSAFDSTQQAVSLAAGEGIGVLGASNYYDFSAYSTLADEAAGRGVFPLFGLEIICLIDELIQAGVKINDPGNPGKMYVCGKAITGFEAPAGRGMSEQAQRLLQTIRDNDAARMAEITARLAAIFAGAGLDTGLTVEVIKDRVAARYSVARETVYLQERHVAQAFQEALFEAVAETDRAALLAKAYGTPPKAAPGDAGGVQNDIRSLLMKAGKAAFVPDTFVGFDHAYRLILALGGIPCYPVLADGATPICPYEADVDHLITDLKARGIYAAELIPIRNAPEVVSRYVRALRGAGLIVTGGTEHNTPDLLPLTPTCQGNVPLPDDVAAIFREGACVVAAHQYRTRRGEPGFVDAEGRPAAGYGSDDERIQAFAGLGAAVIAAYSAV